MGKYFLTFIFIGFLIASFAQQSLTVKVIDGHSGEELTGASVIETNLSIGGSTSANGLVTLSNLANGEHQLKVSFIGYRDTLVSVAIPRPGNDLVVKLLPLEEELEEIIVSTTRTNARIEDLPLKVEVLGLEEMDEESTLVPGNIGSILGDLAVITIQRTNPVNGNDAIRMQGLDPQYTLIARDGLPLYGGFSGSLGVLAIPPLDLKQVEIIKGSVSTLYGGGAIAGMINFISREPADKPQRTILANASTLKEKNLNSFFSGKIAKSTGYTLFAGANVKSAYDVNKDGFSEVPEHQNYTVHPRLFFALSDKSKLNVGITCTIDNRRTGDMKALSDSPSAQHPYLRTEKTWRNVFDAQYNHSWNADHSFSIKTALSTYHRELSVPVLLNPNFHFDGVQNSSYSEISDRTKHGKHTLVLGVNLITESLHTLSVDNPNLGEYNFVTAGAFAQDDWQVTEKFSIETGVRLDHHNVKGFFPLPRIALFFKPNSKLSLRIASGAGYKTPNILSLSDPNQRMRNNFRDVNAERSFGANTDINYKTVWFNELEVSLNQAFYFARVRDPLRVISDSTAVYLENQNYEAISYGTDSYVQLVFKNCEIYLGYNHTEAYQNYNTGKNPMPFNPKDKFSTTLAYAIEGKWRMGIEASYSANQYIYGSLTYRNSETIYPSVRVPNFWFWAAMVERKFGFGSVVLNVENLFDARQSKFQSLYDGTVTAPVFKPIWGPLDGRVINLSVKVNL